MNLKALFAHCGIVYNEVEFEEKDELRQKKAKSGVVEEEYEEEDASKVDIREVTPPVTRGSSKRDQIFQ